MHVFVVVMAVLAGMVACVAAVPSPALFFNQTVDHFSAGARSEAKFAQRYYLNDTHFKGPGSPIFVIMGGEGAIEPTAGFYYPWVLHVAELFGALVVENEHRFYGESQPSGPFNTQKLDLLTPQQALADTATLIISLKEKYGCALDSTAPTGCPVLTFGGSYPGLLSAMMRIRYPSVVDFAYSASAPFRIFNETVDQYAYYKVVTDAADAVSPNCSTAVRSMLQKTLGSPSITRPILTSRLNLCSPLPAYLAAGSASLLAQEIHMVVMYTFAGLSMGNYPPPNTPMHQSCQRIQSTVDSDPWDALATFLQSYAQDAPLGGEGAQAQCFNLSAQLPAGDKATITSGDWTGVGSGPNGASWDFETCTYMISPIGVNGKTDMFLPREWTLEWLTDHCKARFDVTPRPNVLSPLWGFGRMEQLPTSHIVFTNGARDGWSVGGVTRSIPSKNIIAETFPEGAHHSDLRHDSFDVDDTEPVKRFHARFIDTLRVWLFELRSSSQAE